MVSPMTHEGNLLLGATWPGAISTSRSRLGGDCQPVQMLRFLETSLQLCLWAAVPRRDLMGWKKYLLPIVRGLESLDHHQNRKPKLWIQADKLARFWEIGKGQLLLQLLLQLGSELLSTAGTQHSSSRKWLCREQPGSQTRHSPDRSHGEAGRRQGQGRWRAVRRKPATHL